MKLFKNKKRLIWLCSVAALLAVIITACGIYVSDYYRADLTAIADFEVSKTVDVNELQNGVTVYEAEKSVAGFIFYPGGKVEHTAYEPLMKALAEKGITSVLVKMPFNLAVLDMKAADGVSEQLPDIEKWYIGGHSLGGSIAASYISENTDVFDGLVLLASYSTADISAKDNKVLSVYGSEDKVLNLEKYEKYKANLPDSFTEYVIDGGSHAGFGMYGAQKGDGEPTITNEEQIRLTAEQIFKFISE